MKNAFYCLISGLHMAKERIYKFGGNRKFQNGNGKEKKGIERIGIQEVFGNFRR